MGTIYRTSKRGDKLIKVSGPGLPTGTSMFEDAPPYRTTPENDRIRIASMKKLGRTMPCKCPICRKRIINIHGEQMWRFPDQTLLHKKCWRGLLKTLPKAHHEI